KTGSELTCEDQSPSPLTPTSHTLRPADIKVLAALGDSLTAANGAGGSPNNILDVLVEYRGLSWIGGDENLTSVTTLPIFREFNPNLTGFAVGTGNEGSPGAFLNQAVAGANSRVDFENDWKVITMFIGGNDLCDHCTDTVPRALVNLVEVLNIIPLRRLHQDKSLNCPTWLVMLCRCVMKPPDDSAEVQVLKDLNRAYQSGMRELVESGRYDTHSNFTVVVQPFFREVVLPLLEDGRPDRSFFASDCFHLSQKSHSLMARALWNNMLEPLGNKTYIHDFTNDLSLKCNWGSDFSCAIHGPSDPVPSSHRLRPTDIKVLAALGDSISAGFGAKSKNLLQLKNEYRGVSWIGGDQTLETVTTLPILRKFNPSLHGFSTGIGTAQRGFNMAVSGAKADIPAQVETLIQALRDSKEVDFENDWKLVTLFIGGNDLCQYCQDRQVPRMLVNVLEILQIDGLRKIKRDSLGCSLQRNMCPCALTPGEDSLELSEMRWINREFQQGETERLVWGGRYSGREDFAVVIQPFFQTTIIPLGLDGKPDLSFFSVDCFHFSERGHAEMAMSLWNNMSLQLEPVGQKQTYNNFTYDRNKLRCPTEDQPYIFTIVNSFPSIPTTTAAAPTPPASTATPFQSLCGEIVPAWAVALVGVTGLLIGWGVTWILLFYREQRMKRTATLNVELKGAGF
uniref:Si:ch211-214p16.3 n=1 Tax=Paramormyrops kingsleyae TaxID=1676925 RepID=A0A3B3QLG3_9TELE